MGWREKWEKNELKWILNGKKNKYWEQSDKKDPKWISAPSFISRKNEQPGRYNITVGKIDVQVPVTMIIIYIILQQEKVGETLHCVSNS